MVSQGNLFSLAHGSSRLTKTIRQSICIEVCLCHDNAKTFQTFGFACENSFEFCERIVLRNVVERRHVTCKTCQRCRHVICSTLGKTERFSHCAKCTAVLFSNLFGQTICSNSILGKLFHPFGHGGEYRIHNILHFTQVGTKFNAGLTKVDNLFDSKASRQYARCFLGKTLYTVHLLIKRLTVHYQIQANLPNRRRIFCHAFVPPFLSIYIKTP